MPNTKSPTLQENCPPRCPFIPDIPIQTLLSQPFNQISPHNLPFTSPSCMSVVHKQANFTLQLSSHFWASHQPHFHSKKAKSLFQTAMKLRELYIICISRRGKSGNYSKAQKLLEGRISSALPSVSTLFQTQFLSARRLWRAVAIVRKSKYSAGDPAFHL